MSRQFRHSRGFRAFTIAELLISIAIIFILITAVSVALKGARHAAARAGSLNALRQIMTGYAGYAAQHNGLLLPGYVDPARIGPNATDIIPQAKLETGFVLSPQDSASFVWRLAPYLNHDWKTFMDDYRDGDLVTRFVGEYAHGDAGGAYGPGSTTGNQLGISAAPSFGLNSVYLGGDNVHADPIGNPWVAWPNLNPNTIAAQRMSQALNPSKVIVFAPVASSAQPNNSGTSSILGFPELCPPLSYFDRTTQVGSQPQWYIETAPGPTLGQIVPEGMMGDGAGLPISRAGDSKIPVSHLDGSTTSEFLAALEKDMSYWSAFATGAH